MAAGASDEERPDTVKEPAGSLHEKQQMLPDGKAEEGVKPVQKAIGVDTGWAWLVMVAVFIIFFILDGLISTFGIMYVSFLESFRSTKGETAMIGALMYGVPLLVTPLCCGCIEIAGFRRVTMAGGVVTFLVFFVSVFANSVMFLTVSLGLVGGVAVALSYDSSLLCLSHYFDKRRGLATGIAMSSSGVGTFTFAPFVEYLLSTYGWRGALLILSGFCMNVIACGAIFRPLQYLPSTTKPRDEHATSEELLDDRTHEDTRMRIQLISTSLQDLREKESSDTCYRSDSDLSRGVRVIESRDKITSWTSRSSVRNMAAEKFQESKPKKSSGLQQLLHEFLRVFRLCFDRKLFRNPKWVLFVISNALYCTSFGFPYIYIPHLAILSGIKEEDAALLLSVLGIATMVFLLTSAAAADYTRHVVPLYALTRLCSSTSLIVFPYISGNYLAMCLVTVLYSVGLGAHLAMGTLIIIDIVGLDDLVIAYGQMSVVKGISITFGTPVGGWVYDAMGSYDMPFIAGGVAVLLSGLILLPLPIIDRRKRRLNRLTEDDDYPER